MPQNLCKVKQTLGCCYCKKPMLSVGLSDCMAKARFHQSLFHQSLRILNVLAVSTAQNCKTHELQPKIAEVPEFHMPDQVGR